MKEYFGDSAKKYSQPSDKYFTLFPALELLIPPARDGMTLIDLGCGTGDLSGLARSKGYGYIGLDYSDDMLARAREHYPSETFIQGDVTKQLEMEKETFDVVLCNMLFPSIATQENFAAVFSNARALCAKDGMVVVSVGHPCFDGYMTKKLLSRDDIETDFTGYFASGANYKVHRKLGENAFVFSDYHWTLTDYLLGAKKAGLYLDELNECNLTERAPEEVVQKVQSRGIPSYLVFRFKKSHVSE